MTLLVFGIFAVLLLGAAAVRNFLLGTVGVLGLSVFLAYLSVSSGWSAIGTIIAIALPIGVLIFIAFLIEEQRSKEFVEGLKSESRDE